MARQPDADTATAGEVDPVEGESQLQPYDEEPVDDEGALEDPNYDPMRDDPAVVAANRQIAGGVVMLTVGAGFLAGGIAMALIDPCTLSAGNSCNANARERAALTMSIPAAAIVAGGAVMLALGVRKRRRVRADLVWDPRGRVALIGVHGRF